MPKIQLSAEEMQLVASSHWILTKHRVIEKVYHLFGSLSDQMQVYVQEQKEKLPTAVLQSPPKISKGEQYEALPYVVLDYPRLFSKEDVFGVRCFFWWGNYFSITLHLKGKFYQQCQQKIAMAVAEKTLMDYYFSTSGSEFSFNLSGKNYAAVNDVINNWQEVTEEHAFLKIARKISFEHWDTAEQQLMQAFEQLLALTHD